jgi:hypothetical protein
MTKYDYFTQSISRILRVQDYMASQEISISAPERFNYVENIRSQVSAAQAINSAL